MKAALAVSIASVVTALVSAQSDFCATPSDFTNSTTVGGDCDITDGGQTNSTRQQLCINSGYSLEDGGTRCEGNGLDYPICVGTLEATWDAPTCEQLDYYIRQGFGQMTQQQICANTSLIYGINMIESSCCGSGDGAEYCPPPPVCQSNSDFVGDAVVRGECALDPQVCQSHGFWPDGDSNGEGGNPGCSDMPPARCVELGGNWRNFTCGELRNWMAPAIMTGNCSGENGLRINMVENLCCGGNAGAGTCPESQFRQVCAVPANYQPENVVMGQCITNSSAASRTACENANGRPKQDDGQYECDGLDEAGCNSMGSGIWVNRTCADGFFHVNSPNFNCADSAEIPMLIEQHCCSGTPVSDSVCGPKVEFCNAEQDFNPDNTFFKQCGLCRDVEGGPNGPNCNSSDLSNQCIDAGGRMMWEDRDFSCIGDSLNESICNGMGGRFEPITCLNAQAHVSFALNLSDLCADAETASLTQFIPKCCSPGTARSICGAPAQICDSSEDFDDTATLWNQCKFCRDFETDCGYNDEGPRSAGPSPSPPRRQRRDHSSGSGSGSDGPCNGPDCNQGCGGPPQHPICMNPTNMSRACTLAGGIWSFVDQACMNITRQQCNAIPVGRWDPIFCDQAPLFIGQSMRSNNMTGRCADPDVRPKFDVLRKCCGDNPAVNLCQFSTPPPSIRNRVRLFLDFVGRLDDFTDAQKDEFIYRLKTAIVARSGGIISLEDIIRVVLTAISGSLSNRDRRQTDQIRAQVDFAQTANPVEISGAVAVIEAANQQDPLTFEVNGQTYSVEAVITDVEPTSGGASDLIPLSFLQMMMLAIGTLAIAF